MLGSFFFNHDLTAWCPVIMHISPSPHDNVYDSMPNSKKESHCPPGNHHASHFKNVLFPDPNHLLTTGTDDSSLTGARAIISVGSSAPVVSRWIRPGNRTFLEVASVVITWWIVAFLSGAMSLQSLLMTSPVSMMATTACVYPHSSVPRVHSSSMVCVFLQNNSPSQHRDKKHAAAAAASTQNAAVIPHLSHNHGVVACHCSLY